MLHLKAAIRPILTLAMVGVSIVLTIALWHQYMLAPWTRDGRISADVVQIAPEVSGTIREVHVVDNQLVHRGDILYQIDPERFQLAVDQAISTLEARRQTMQLQASTARRRSALVGVASVEVIEQAVGAASIAEADFQSAQAAFNLAKLNLARATVRASVDGYVTNLRMRPGDYAVAGTTKVAMIDAGSFWVTGYFEETQLRTIRTGAHAEIRMMGFDDPVTGHVESIGRGIADANATPDHLGLPSVNPVFTWVRLAQRIPVRLHIDSAPSTVMLAMGMTCSIAIGEPSEGHQARLLSLIRAVL
ncbi:HlyD family secretion protein [Rhodopseudomonas boonkerdii]|uniref:efflux RND transporter periplasmic adaptor subunit n=1 Tax=Rhodopseudomonas boonkerdii TaxID=475937 RepID=UPI001E5CF42A|nr:HlyD family secretion protein [Rhodopseudomonas boonkerdii]UGV28487.1 HlyD family secretion protein [Rhodopseudomonas boonkerdii]